jgi:hypothetical protein
LSIETAFSLLNDSVIDVQLWIVRKEIVVVVHIEPGALIRQARTLTLPESRDVWCSGID